jgi:hypothetical protein
MKYIEELHKLFMLYNFYLQEIDSLINWAMDRLTNDEEENDNNVVLLAISNDEPEARELTQKILNRYMVQAELSEEYLCGKYIVELHQWYKDGKIEIIELYKIMTKLFSGLGYPDWLVMLSRNCEYATDMTVFEKHFQDEFNNIADLWKKCDSLEEFKQKYDRKTSNSHDVENC